MDQKDCQMIIKKKTWPEYFEKVLSGEKTFDYRLADFDCHPGDTLVLEEWNPETKEYTGRKVEKKVGFVGQVKNLDFGIPKDIAEKYGFQIISLK